MEILSEIARIRDYLRDEKSHRGGWWVHVQVDSGHHLQFHYRQLCNVFTDASLFVFFGFFLIHKAGVRKRNVQMTLQGKQGFWMKIQIKYKVLSLVASCSQ